MNENQANNIQQVDYVSFDNRPLAQLKSQATPNDKKLITSEVVYLHTDHLNTPRTGTDTTGKVVWNWQSDAFGIKIPVAKQPNKVVVNLRFPGQYFDTESGLYYNYHRYYDPQTGRYISSDPIGLEGGLNTYGYVGGNPVRYIDLLGLRELTGFEKSSLAPYISTRDLNNADVHVGEMPWYAPDWAAGITRGNDIYIRDPNQSFLTPDDLALLGHELVHVGQYADGMSWISYTWESLDGYMKNPYEIEAYDMGKRITKELEKVFGDLCKVK